ncbi:hypothetical protein EYC84_005923 [Monilinia fructicola]|uniref:Uncharacterized protein n=1 Tax=Monilinia fructicola TaxID=38448 RepID=A0A5M9K383_MONFR|nr:hypothetical protein EYC84_005923 [Monilinia fructicola]
MPSFILNVGYNEYLNLQIVSNKIMYRSCISLVANLARNTKLQHKQNTFGWHLEFGIWHLSLLQRSTFKTNNCFFLHFPTRSHPLSHSPSKMTSLAYHFTPFSYGIKSWLSYICLEWGSRDSFLRCIAFLPVVFFSSSSSYFFGVSGVLRLFSPAALQQWRNRSAGDLSFVFVCGTLDA